MNNTGTKVITTVLLTIGILFIGFIILGTSIIQILIALMLAVIYFMVMDKIWNTADDESVVLAGRDKN